MITIPVDEARVADLLCTGFEGGSFGVGYWGRIIGYVEPETVWTGRDWGADNPRYVLYPLSEGGGVILRDAELPDPDDAVLAMMESLIAAKNMVSDEIWLLDREALARGLRAFPNHPHHLKRWLEKNEDAETGEIFVQLCLFGELVYG